MTEQQPMSMEEVQTQVIASLEGKLASTTWLVEQAQNTIAQILNMASGKIVTPVNQIAINLLVRIWNELRAVLILCQHGYVLQAFSPTAVIYEAGLTVAAIGNSEEAAKKWFMHDVEERSYDNVKRLTEAGFKNLLGNEGTQEVDTYYTHNISGSVSSGLPQQCTLFYEFGNRSPAKCPMRMVIDAPVC